VNKKQFIESLAPMAVRARREGSPMFPSVRLAQNLLETGGKIHSWHNLGGIKVGSGKPNDWWTGKVVHKGTWEVYDGMRTDITAAFRAYDSVYHFYKDQDLLFQLSRYRRVREAKTPEEQCRMLQACGYATDPSYANKLISLIRTNNLLPYDNQAAPEEEDAVAVIVNGVKSEDGFLDESRAFIPIRVVAKACGASIDWNAGENRVVLNGEPIAPDHVRLIEGKSYIAARTFADMLQATIEWDDASRTVTLTTG